ncbi:hypothetical protein [Brevibacterium aurantiacum]|uniref:hypothetical protein n=1 Tax=Brevibacterium aurantiacum TaxID=273384 RepID=UPI00186774FB|nr:hypothetical protein [Brevibacterium aurantiacum]
MRSTDISSQFDPVYDRLVHKAPTRSRESAQILDCLRAGRSVVVVGLTGDGALDFARSLATTLARPEPALLRVTAQTTADDVREFTDPANNDGEPRIICGAHVLPPDTDSIIGRALHSSRVPIAYIVDGDRLRAVNLNDPGPLSQIAAAWSSGALERIDLARLTSSESLALVTGLSTTVPLDDLQLRTLAALSAGRPLLAADLVAWAEESPHRVPQRYPPPTPASALLPSATVRCRGWRISIHCCARKRSSPPGASATSGRCPCARPNSSSAIRSLPASST